MVFTQFGAQTAIYRIGSNTGEFIGFFAIGSGSGAVTISNTTLQAESGTRIAITGSPNFSTPYKVSFQGDYNSTAISGINLREFGLFTSGTSNVGSVWLREGFNTIAFDGTQELQLSASIEAIPG